MLLDKLKSPYFLVPLFIVLLVVASLLIVTQQIGYNRLFLFLILVVVAAYTQGRKLYIPMLTILTGTTVWIVCQVAPDLRRTLESITIAVITCVVLCEVLHHLKMSRMRVLASERAQRLLAETLMEVTLTLTSQTSQSAILDEIVIQAQRLVPFKAADIGLLHDNIFRTVASYGYDAFGAENYIANLVQPITELPRALDAVRSRQPVIIPDTRVDPRWVNYAPTAWVRSYLAVPICLREHVLGLLSLVDDDPGAFSEEDAARLSGVAHAAAIAIGNVQFYQGLQDHALHLEQRVEERAHEIETNYAQLQAILNSTTDGILVTDLHGSIVLMNPVARTWLQDLLPVDDQQRIRDTVRDMVRQAHTRPEVVLELDGLDLELQAAPITSPSATASVVVALHNVSHLRTMDRMRTNFIHNVSHELRTPVATIKAYADLMTRLPQRRQEYLARLSREADRQAKLVEDIVELSRIDAGESPERSRVALNELSRKSLASDILMLAEERGIRLRHVFAESNPEVMSDFDHLLLIITKLLENAIHYTPVGGEVVLVTDTVAMNGRFWAKITIQDSGIGILESESPFIFDRFYRGERAQIMRASGSGLGLAIVNELVKLYEGHITVESHVNAGSTFTVWLPLVTERVAV